MRYFVIACGLLGAMSVVVAYAEDPDKDVYAAAFVRADKAGTLILFVYSKDTGENISDSAKHVLLSRSRRAVTARMVVQYIPINTSDRRYAHYRSQIKGEGYPFWALTKPDGEFLAGGDYETVGADGAGGWRKTVAGFAKQFPPIGASTRKRIAKMLAQAQADLEAGRLGDVQPVLGKLAQVWYPTGLVNQCVALRSSYDRARSQLIERPGVLLAQENLLGAALAYQQVIDAFKPSSDEAGSAREGLRSLLDDRPELRMQFNEELRQQRARAAAEAAAKAKAAAAAREANAKPTDATPSQEAGEGAVDDPAEAPNTAPTEALDAATQERRAGSLVNMAKQYMSRDMTDKAKAKLQQCVEKYPETEAADEARRLLARW